VKQKTILSTKRLPLLQKELLINAGVSLVEYNAILIEFLDFKISPRIESAIFTSQNAVKAFINKHSSLEENRKLKCYCVGDKTKALLEENGQKVIKKTRNASELAQFITKNCKNDSFLFFCGSKRKEELPKALKNAKIDFFEVKTYKTMLKTRAFNQEWDGILFFSPSGVESFAQKNNIKNSIAFCIGETTASEAKKYSDNIIVAHSTTVESVIAKAIKTIQYDEN